LDTGPRQRTLERIVAIKIIAEVWDHAEIDGNALLTLLALADSADPTTRECWPGVPNLMRKSRSSRATVYRNLDLLQAQGFIEKLIPAKAHYRVHWRMTPVEKWSAMGSQLETSEGDHS
jgi:hypothetical protein